MLIIPSMAISGGFENKTLAQKSVSMAGVFTGIANDASAAWFNPSAMSFFEAPKFMAGINYSSPATSYLSPYSGNHNMKSVNFIPFHLYGAFMLNDRTFVGIAVNKPFRYESNWESDWPGRYISTYSKFSVTSIKPSIGYRLNDNFSIGAGISLNFCKQEDTRMIPVTSDDGDIISTFEGNGLAFGFDLTASYKPNDETTLGLSLKSGSEYKMDDGEITFQRIPTAVQEIYPEKSDAKSSMKTPWSISVGMAKNISRKLMIAAEIKYALWSGTDSTAFEVKENQDLSYGIGKEYENSLYLGAGSEYTVSDNIRVRAGVGYETGAIKDQFLDPRIPDADKYIFAFGGTFKFSDFMSIDISYMLENYTEREATNSQYNFTGNYKTFTNTFGISLNYEFE